MLLAPAFSSSQFAENVDPANDGSQYAWAENGGWLSAEPAGNGGPGAQVQDFQLTGWLWGENLGWVSLSCQNTGSCGTSAYGVLHDSFGVLSGFAWAENAGWIDFGPGASGVSFDTDTGDFSGYAWGENIGWISFNCVNTASCGTAQYRVRTSWTCTAPPPSGSPSLVAGKSPTATTLSWTALAGAGRYDVVRGSLAVLRATGGDFESATEGCVVDNESGTAAMFSGDPGAGDGFWFLVRGVNCGGDGTFDSSGAAQVGDRDGGIAESVNSCP
jgi:hypothetical protein